MSAVVCCRSSRSKNAPRKPVAPVRKTACGCAMRSTGVHSAAGTKANSRFLSLSNAMRSAMVRHLFDRINHAGEAVVFSNAMSQLLAASEDGGIVHQTGQSRRHSIGIPAARRHKLAHAQSLHAHGVAGPV